MSRDEFCPARRVGLKVLNLFGEEQDNAAGLLRKHIDQTDQRSFVTDVVLGVVRNRQCIDRIIHRVGEVPVERIARRVVNILRMGVYELVYCPDREMHAIVSETMKLTDGMAARQRGFVNAILRKVCRLMAERGGCHPGLGAIATVPLSETTGCRFSIELFADPAKHPAQYLSEAFSLPLWLVDGWVEAYGFRDSLDACFGSNRRPSVYVRPNRLKGSGLDLVGRFRDEGIDCEIVVDDGLVLQTRGGRAIELLPGYGDGLFNVQDITSSEAVRMMKLKPGMRVLDLCAAPGGKTIQMVEEMRDEGEVYATDADSARLKLVRENVERMGVKCVKVIPHDEVLQAAQKAGGFDAVLLDVPCSNTGVMARRVEVRYRLSAKRIASLARAQRNILVGAAELVRPGGMICYSTCSVEAGENNEVVEWFVSERKDFELVTDHLRLPSAGRIDRDGGYAAILLKGNRNRKG